MHSIRQSGLVLKKGTLIGKPEIAALQAAGIAEIVVARIEPGDVSEDAAAAEIAAAVAGAGCASIAPSPAGPICSPRAPACWWSTRTPIDRLNQVDESITFATLAGLQARGRGRDDRHGQDHSVRGRGSGARCRARGRRGGRARWCGSRPIVIRKIGVVSTVLPGLATKVIEKTLKVTAERLTPAGAAHRRRAARAARAGRAGEGDRGGAGRGRRARHRVRRLGHRRPARRDPGRGRRRSAGASSISACRSIPATCS